VWSDRPATKRNRLLLFAPRALHGGVPDHAWILAAVFVSFVIFDVIVLPFSVILSR